MTWHLRRILLYTSDVNTIINILATSQVTLFASYNETHCCRISIPSSCGSMSILDRSVTVLIKSTVYCIFGAIYTGKS